MALKCKIGLHSWDGCKCTECEKIRNKQHDWSKDFDKCFVCGGTKMTTIEVKILNKSLSLIESISRWVQFWKKSSFFRSALLICVLDEIKLGYKDDFENYNFVTKLQFSKIKRVKYKPDAISRLSQIIKPAIFGIILSILLLIFFGSGRRSGLVAIFPMFFIIKGLIEMKKVSMIIIESIDSEEVSFLVDKNNFKELAYLLSARNIEFEDINNVTITESTSIIDTTVENAIIELKSLIDSEKKKSFFGKTRRNEIDKLIQDNCKTKDDALILLKSYSGKFKSNLIEDLTSLSSSYDSKKEIINSFIEFNIVDNIFPHKLL